MGSFVWVDMLRIAGVKPENIKVLSVQDKPYKRYESLLRNCQIPRYKRIRSGSDSCPDNIWGVARICFKRCLEILLFWTSWCGFRIFVASFC